MTTCASSLGCLSAMVFQAGSLKSEYNTDENLQETNVQEAKEHAIVKSKRGDNSDSPEGLDAVTCLSMLNCLPFIQAPMARKGKVAKITFSVSRETCFGEQVRVVGNVAALGQWDPNYAAPMEWIDDETGNHVWATTIEVAEFPPDGEPLQYKYVVMYADGETKEWEECENRVIHLPKVRRNGGVWHVAQHLRFERYQCWNDRDGVSAPPTPKQKFRCDPDDLYPDTQIGA